MKPSLSSVLFASSLPVAALVAACGGSPTSSTSSSSSTSGSGGAGSTTSDASSSSTSTSTASTSSAEGSGGGAGCMPTTSMTCQNITTTASCIAVTPFDTGASSAGQNACAPHYALYPSAGPNGKLVIFLNGSGGHPANAIASPTQNFYVTATDLGYAVLALSYRSDTEVAVLCAGTDGCYFPTRETLILGVLQPNASPMVDDIVLDEGIVDRTVLALQWLGQHDSAHPWTSFLKGGSNPQSQIDWSQIVVAGHSQGGGHATALGKMFPTIRVIQLSSPCDAVAGKPATWLVGDNTWMTDPGTAFWGLDAPTDPICPTYAKAWQSLGMPAAHSNGNAQTCGTPTSHEASIKCAVNQDAWKAMLQ